MHFLEITFCYLLHDFLNTKEVFLREWLWLETLPKVERSESSFINSKGSVLEHVCGSLTTHCESYFMQTELVACGAAVHFDISNSNLSTGICFFVRNSACVNCNTSSVSSVCIKRMIIYIILIFSATIFQVLNLLMFIILIYVVRSSSKVS